MAVFDTYLLLPRRISPRVKATPLVQLFNSSSALRQAQPEAGRCDQSGWEIILKYG
jgi:hypothetical protein